MGKSIKLLSAAVAVALLSSNASYATNGMFMIGTGAKARSMGGVGITMNHDVFTTVANPATMTQIEGNRFDIGADIFKINAEASMGTGANKRTAESKTDFMTIVEGVYVMPALGATWNDGGDLSYGFTMVPVGGGGSRYTYNLFNCTDGRLPDNDPKCSDELGVNLMVMNINPTIALKLDEQNSIGATLIIGFQVFNASGLTEFTQFTTTQNDTAKLTNQGEDYAYGAGVRLGWLGNFMQDTLVLGFSYTSQTYMSRFDKYSDLFAEQGKMNTPGNVGIGASYKINKALTVAMDINYVMYEDVKAVSNPGPDPRGNMFPVDRETNALGKNQGLGFGWENQTVFKVGVIYEYNPTWTLRAGWNYAKSPIDEEYDILFSLVAPAITQNHLTMGTTWQMNKEMELSFSYVHAFEFEQQGPTYINSEASYKMSQDSLGASFGMRF